eukprot:c8388_g1_i1.p1 GENE.c8388_g1_i1~~c8388_g1_i1.p1  ORF type:complete len:679 (-),score=173.14 c8388_g1_i1:31-2031(-)
MRTSLFALVLVVVEGSGVPILCQEAVYRMYCPFCTQLTAACNASITDTPLVWKLGENAMAEPSEVQKKSCWQLTVTKSCPYPLTCGTWDASAGWMLLRRFCTEQTTFENATVSTTNNTSIGTFEQNSTITNVNSTNVRDDMWRIKGVEDVMKWANVSHPEDSPIDLTSLDQSIAAELFRKGAPRRVLDLSTILEPSKPRNVTAKDFQVQLQYTTEDGNSRGTPNGVEVMTTAVNNGWWLDDFSCCNDWDVNRINNPEIVWDSGLPNVGSWVVMIDDIDDQSIEWLMINIDPREHRISFGASGECPWWQLVYPWRYGKCNRNRLPGSGYELPNRDWNWRFRGFCPPNHQVHRYRIRVFAQDEWDQSYLQLNWPDSGPDDISRQLTRIGRNVGIASLIANGARRAECHGPSRTPPKKFPPAGIVGDYDFSQETLKSLTADTPNLIDIGERCADKKAFRVRYVGNNVRGLWKKVLSFRSGTGLAFNTTERGIPSGGDTAYTIVMDVNMQGTGCYVRLINVNPPSPNGWFLCDGVMLYPETRIGYPLSPNSWYHIVVSTRPDLLTKVYINGALQRQWYARNDTWQNALRLPDVSGNDGSGFSPQAQSQPPPPKSDSIVFFNDCGLACRCANGKGLQSGGLVHRIQIYNRMLSDQEVEQVYQVHTTNPAGI